jgi:hypothetical protein
MMNPRGLITTNWRDANQFDVRRGGGCDVEEIYRRREQDGKLWPLKLWWWR